MGFDDPDLFEALQPFSRAVSLAGFLHPGRTFHLCDAGFDVFDLNALRRVSHNDAAARTFTEADLDWSTMTLSRVSLLGIRPLALTCPKFMKGWH